MFCMGVEHMIYFYEGPAGSGKTTGMMQQLVEHIGVHPLLKYQRVLGLTMMHGARHRLIAKLSSTKQLDKQFCCSTFDAFSWKILTRWKTFYTESINSKIPETYDDVCDAAAQLLEFDSVRSWVARTYPIILIDEAQDCKKGRLEIMKELAQDTVMFVAADEFQDLSTAQHCESVVWLRSITKPNQLEHIHRTNVKALLQMASALRNGGGVIQARGSKICTAPSHHLSAAIIAYYLLNKDKSVVILSPTNRDKSPFVRKTVDLLCDGVRLRKLGDIIKSFDIRWENNSTTTALKAKAAIELPQDSTKLVDKNSLNLTGDMEIVKRLAKWMNRRCNLTGSTNFSVKEISEQIDLISQNLRAYSHTGSEYVSAMTIHQAKNQEFNHVVVLWPYQVSNDGTANRKLAYNAVTRAKKSCLIIVQGNNNRLSETPFR